MRRDFAELQIKTPEQLTTLFLADTQDLRAWVADVSRPNSDDDNWLERRMPLELNRRHREDLKRRIRERFSATRMAALLRTLPGLPEERVVRATVQPQSTVFSSAAPLLTRGLLEHYRAQGDSEAEARIRGWVREFERGHRRRLTREHYDQLVSGARRARDRGDQEAAAAQYRELLEFPGQSAYHEAGVALAEMLIEAGRVAEAATLARRMQARFPARAEAYEIEIRALLVGDRSQEACAVWRRASLLGAAPSASEPEECGPPEA